MCRGRKILPDMGCCASSRASVGSEEHELKKEEDKAEESESHELETSSPEAVDCEQKLVRIAVWSTPRALSTALLRSFLNRPDTTGVDEPFYAEWLQRTGSQYPDRDAALAAGDPNLDEAAAHALANGYSVLFEKHMIKHLQGDFPHKLPASFWAQRRHVFLLRDPVQVLSSVFADFNADLSDADIGLGIMDQLVSRLAEDSHNLVFVDASDILRSPRATLQRLCAVLRLDFDEAMLKWEPGAHPCYRQSCVEAHMYKNAVKSSGFNPSMPRKRKECPGECRALCDELLPIYERLRQRCISP